MTASSVISKQLILYSISSWKEPRHTCSECVTVHVSQTTCSFVSICHSHHNNFLLWRIWPHRLQKYNHRYVQLSSLPRCFIVAMACPCLRVKNWSQVSTKVLPLAHERRGKPSHERKKYVESTRMKINILSKTGSSIGL